METHNSRDANNIVETLATVMILAGTSTATEMPKTVWMPSTHEVSQKFGKNSPTSANEDVLIQLETEKDHQESKKKGFQRMLMFCFLCHEWCSQGWSKVQNTLPACHCF
jgi:hypothetical protein